jgi:hypothetical protein
MWTAPSRQSTTVSKLLTPPAGFWRTIGLDDELYGAISPGKGRIKRVGGNLADTCGGSLPFQIDLGFRPECSRIE